MKKLTVITLGILYIVRRGKKDIFTIYYNQRIEN